MQLGLPAPTSPRGLFLFCVRDESPDRSVWELRVTGSPSLPSSFLCSFLPASPHPLVSVSSSLYRCLPGWLSLLASLLLYLPFQPPLISGFFSWPAIFCQSLPPSHLPHLDMPSLVLLFPDPNLSTSSSRKASLIPSLAVPVSSPLLEVCPCFEHCYSEETNTSCSLGSWYIVGT